MLIAIAVMGCLIVAYLYYLHAEKKKHLEAMYKEIEAQNMRANDVALQELDNIGNLLYDNALSDDEVLAKTEASLTVIEANNPNGTMTEIINDVRKYTRESLNTKAKNS